METLDIWNNYHSEFYFFILKRIKDPSAADEILQNSFLKIHQNINSLKDPGKAKAWGFQIVRNEISNFRKEKTPVQNVTEVELQDVMIPVQHFCCFNRFVSQLPPDYKEVIKLVYFSGKKQQEAATILDLSLADVKAKIRRSKEILKKNFNECCQYKFNEEGKLVGEGNCSVCS